MSPDQNRPAPKRALALSADGAWALILARFPSTCLDCKRKLGRGRKLAWHAELRTTLCTRCARSVSFTPTPYGLRRKRANRALGRQKANSTP